MFYKLIFNCAIILILNGFTSSQVKVNFSLGNPSIENGYFKMDVIAVVQTGQNWRVGSSNLRFDFTTTPPGSATIKLDNPVSGANPNLSGNSNYSAMTTTSILGGTAISLNITRLNNCYNLSPGTYVLGRIRFNRIDTTGCINLSIRTNSVVQDSITQLLNPGAWTLINPPTCIRLDYLTGLVSNNELPTIFKLYNNYPNPFNPFTSIKYDIPRKSYVVISVFDVLGRLVTELLKQEIEPGRYEVNWDGTNYSSGAYFYKLETEHFTDIKKMILVK